MVRLFYSVHNLKTLGLTNKEATLFLPSKQKVQTVIKGRVNGPTVESKNEENLGVKDDAFNAMAEAILAATQEKSVLGLAKALKQFCDYCKGSTKDGE